MKADKALELHVGYRGRLIGASKSTYLKKNPDHVVVFNANVLVEGVKVWHGDLDLTTDAKKLQSAAKAIGKPLYILYEMDCRFDTEANPDLTKAIATIFPED